MSERKKKFYAVARGRKPGIYTEWFGPRGAEEQVRNFPGAVFKGFSSRPEAEAFLAEKKGKTGPEKRERRRRPVSGEKKPAADTRERITIYTDGGAIDNPGPGGYGVVIHDGKERRELSGGFRRTTNNRMELMACIVALEQLKEPSAVRIHSDSTYVVNGITRGWAVRWRKNGWMRAAEAPAENADLWARLLDLCETHDVAFVWVRGHAGNPENERCDRLAVKAATGKSLPPDTAYEKGQTRQAPARNQLVK